MSTGKNSEGAVAVNDEDFNHLRQLIMGFRNTQLIYVAGKLHLADHLAQKPQTAEELAPVVNAAPTALYRLLRALASLGVFTESTGGLFEVTPIGDLLRQDKPGSLRSTAMLYGDELIWRVYGRLEYAIETAKPAFEHVHGQPFYDYLSQHPAAATLFHEAMTGFSEQEAEAILAAYNFSTVRSIIDIGGGQGALMATLLPTYSQLRAVIFDRSPPVGEALRLFPSADLRARVEFIQGDFFAAVPDGGDLYLLKSIIHNWSDEEAMAILRKCRQAMPPYGRMLIAERIVPPEGSPSEAKLFDINMLVTVGGQERTAAEYIALLGAAGLAMTRIIHTKSHLSLIEAEPAE